MGRESGSAKDYEAYLLENETYDHPFYRGFFGYNAARATRPILAMRREAAGCTVVAGCEAAYFLASQVGGIGMAIKYGDLAPGARVTRTGYVRFCSTSVDQVFREIGKPKG